MQTASHLNACRRHAGRLLSAALVAVGLVFASCGGSSNDSTPPLQVKTPATSAASATPTLAGVSGGWEGAMVMPPIEKPKAVLTDTSGKPYDLQKETQGYITLLYIGYTHCPDVCPTHMAMIADVLKTLPPDVSAKIKVVFVTADPDRDTADALRKWLDIFNKSYIGLRGTQAQIDAFQEEVGVQPATKEDLGGGNYAVTHAAFVMAFGTDNLAHLVYPLGVTRENWIHDLTKLVKEGWKDS